MHKYSESFYRRISFTEENSIIIDGVSARGVSVTGLALFLCLKADTIREKGELHSGYEYYSTMYNFTNYSIIKEKYLIILLTTVTTAEIKKTPEEVFHAHTVRPVQPGELKKFYLNS